MGSSVWRVVIIGIVLALLVVAVGVAAAVLGVLPMDRLSPKPPQYVLLVVTAPNKDASQVAALPSLITSKDGVLAPAAIDPDQAVRVPGTSAATLAEAYPFGGGAAVAQGYAQLYGGAAPAWVTVPPEVWTRMVDDKHGIEVDVPEGVNAYSAGKLTILEPGRRTISGADALVLVTALDYMPSDVRIQVRTQLQDAVAGAVTADLGALAQAVATGSAGSSMRPETVAKLAGGGQ